ncbi:SixA phosphatase family protein [Sphingomonas sanxanigenens]|uniref:Phosphohistidine phosphatase n=1 Tax=Sphingomonas sanxanigenens DSM 19645 = NX02 TaxID=1123269 RepID=W0AK94_9SPHN|nr:histidine phosphatase family protein [Sphingomonas sanxanigenens]AHE56723.1 hypothetical protein NX02_25590 [Sphingomonas sanxanigenens DSM 19645 = NX02]
MKTLTLLRHAKSSWDDSVPRDFDRPLNRKGERAAATMGGHLKAQAMQFDHVVASPAVRCVETLEKFWDGYGTTMSPVWDKRIYLASCVTLLDVVHDAPASSAHLLMVGHNPGLEDLALLLTPADGDDSLRRVLEEKFPTATVAELQFEVDDWGDIKPRTGRLTRFIRPRDVDPALGPDQG